MTDPLTPTRRPRRSRRRLRRLGAALACVVVGALGLPGGPAGSEPPPAYLTLLFGRTQWSVAPGCAGTPAGALTLTQVANRMRGLGVSGVGAVITTFADGSNGTGRHCTGGIRYANWTDLAALRDTYGWTFVSDGRTRSDLYAMDFAQRHAESCGTIMAFWERGHERAHGLFAYGNPAPGLDAVPPDMVRDQVSGCFAFTRRYTSGERNVRSRMTWPWYQRTRSVSGGLCNDPALACYSDVLSTARRYDSPHALASFAAAEPDEWASLQVYRLVEGARTTGSGTQWDCTDPDWRRHWTSQEEVYCWSDFEIVLRSIPDHVTVTDPLTVASDWRRRG